MFKGRQFDQIGEQPDPLSKRRRTISAAAHSWIRSSSRASATHDHRHHPIREANRRLSGEINRLANFSVRDYRDEPDRRFDRVYRSLLCIRIA